MTGSLRAYARHRAEFGLDGQSLAAVQRAVESGRIVREPDGKIDFSKADSAWAENTVPGVNSRTERHRQVAKKQPASAHRPPRVSAPPAASAPQPIRSRAVQVDGNGFAAARAMREGYMAGLAKLEYDLKSGKLVDSAEVEQVWSAKISAARNRLLLVGAKIAAKLATLSDARVCQSIVDAEIRDALISLMEGERNAA